MQSCHRITPLHLLVILTSFLVLVACETTDDPVPDPIPDLTDRGPQTIDPGFVPSTDLPLEDVILEPKAATAVAVVTEPPYQASKELFDQTFREVRTLIDRLNDLIRKQDYRQWTTHLSEAYIAQASSPQVLAQQSESAILRSKGVVLKNLEDFFKYVVVPSRANVRIDDLTFFSETEVEAIMLFPGSRRVSVYRLIKQGDEWKIVP